MVRVVDEQVDADGPALAKFGRRQQTDAAEQLQLAPSDRRRSGRRRRQEPIQQIDGQREHLLLAVLLLGHLQKQSTTHKSSVSYANFFLYANQQEHHQMTDTDVSTDAEVSKLDLICITFI